MDDCLSDKGTWANDKPIKQVMFDGRHYKLIFILTMQFPLGIKPELRSNFDYIILLADDFISNIKKMYKNKDVKKQKVKKIAENIKKIKAKEGKIKYYRKEEKEEHNENFYIKIG